MAVLVLKQSCQGGSLLQIIINALYQAVFKGKPSACFFKIHTAGLKHILQMIAVGNGHQCLSHLIIGRVKGKGQRDLKALLSKLQNPRHNAAGGYGQVPLADV